jgi:hypothetical protein
MAKNTGGGPNPNKNIAQAEAILNSGGNTNNFTAATWEKLKNIEMANALRNYNPAAVMDGYTPPPSAPTPSSPATSPAVSSPTTYVPPPPPPTPPSPWSTSTTYQTPRGIKQAQPDIVLDPEIDTTGDYIIERFFEEIGGQELINISRHDLIDGINVVYNPIANLSRLRQRFNPNNIIESDFLSQNEARNATIDLISRGMYEPTFDDQGRLVVEIDIIRPEENIEVQVSSSGTLTRIEL